GRLDPEHGSHLRWNALVPRETFADDHRFATEQNRSRLRIDLIAGMTDAIAVVIERVFDHAAALEMHGGSRRHERPAQTRIDAPPRLLAERLLCCGMQMQLLEDRLARDARQHDRRYPVDDEQRIA